MDEINFFAKTNFRNQMKKFGIKTDDRRRHVYAVGKTGMGKTALLENMAIQDIEQGNGIGFVDPHGEAAEKLLDFVPSNRINDVCKSYKKMGLFIRTIFRIVCSCSFCIYRNVFWITHR